MNLQELLEGLKKAVETVKNILREMAKSFSDLVKSLKEDTVYEFEYGRSVGTKVTRNIVGSTIIEKSIISASSNAVDPPVMTERFK